MALRRVARRTRVQLLLLGRLPKSSVGVEDLCRQLGQKFLEDSATIDARLFLAELIFEGDLNDILKASSDGVQVGVTKAKRRGRRVSQPGNRFTKSCGATYLSSATLPRRIVVWYRGPFRAYRSIPSRRRSFLSSVNHRGGRSEYARRLMELQDSNSHNESPEDLDSKLKRHLKKDRRNQLPAAARKIIGRERHSPSGGCC
jgi:hypothetical protein